MTQALHHFKDDPAILANAAIAASQIQDRALWQQGLALGLQALQLDPGRLQTHHVVGNLYQQLGDDHAAHQHFVRASQETLPMRSVQLADTTAVVNRFHAQGYQSTVLAPAQPWVVVVEDFVTAGEVEDMLRLGQPRLTDSYTYAASAAEDDTPALPPRISQTAWLGTAETKLLQGLKTRVLAVLGLDPGQLLHEELQMVHYGAGGYYHPHLDSTQWHPRDVTVLYYLNTAATGTIFSNLSMEAADILRPCDQSATDHGTMAMVPHVQGRAVIFRNTLADGTPDPSTYHGGCVVPAGEEKLLANHWFTLRDTA